MVFMENFREIERKWQERWEKAKIFEANVEDRPKIFTSLIIPYVNADLHIGHGFTYSRTDAYARFKRMQGYNVLLTMAFHATGEPIIGAIKRLKAGDKVQADTFRAFGASEEDLKKFVEEGPEYVARFWVNKIIETAKMMGFSVDWRRRFTTAIDACFSRFIEWQYNTLRKKGYVVQGTHPVVWCPRCQSPTGDHDRLEGEGESPIDFVLIKFRLDSGEIMPSGTLRPETVFGVTNMWINPDVDYVKAEVDKEVWIISQQATEKLKDQLKQVRVLGTVKGSELIGKYLENPKTKEKILILPASFVDPNVATGVVMSVPAHAPYDWIGLVEVKDEAIIRKYGLDRDVVKGIEPISIVSTPGFGDNPAKEVCDRLKIKSSQDRAKLDEATGILYKKEFHQGRLKEKCGEYAGMKVAECKERLIQDFLDEGIVDVMWETTNKVVCRCGTVNHVKILENQWFLKYSDEVWKERVRECLSSMKFYPEEARLQFEKTVEWLKDKACTRKSGLGTPLPWDKEWVVETLSDSTIYMAYYTIARVINEMKIPAEKLTDEVFDYVFLGEGDVKEISRRVGLEEKIIEEMRKEFEYFYPVDMRNSGKDLVQHHLTFFIFHHTAVWDDKKYWPRAIGVNGFVKLKGAKMSKSKGNIFTLRDVVEMAGADLTRINMVASAEGMDDADIRYENTATYRSRIKFLEKLVEDSSKAEVKEVRSIDRFLQSRMQQHIKETTESYEELKFRSGVQSAFFGCINDLKWYLERVGNVKNCNRYVLRDALQTVVKLLAPIMPHVCEELWERLGNKSFVATEMWPKYDESKIDKNALELEEHLIAVVEDLKEVLKLAGKKKSCYLYVVSPDELEYFKEAEDFICRSFGFEKTKVFLASDESRYDPENKAKRAKYGKPGIYLEG